jgi:hypothetical protein
MDYGFDPQDAEEKNSGDGGRGQGGPRLAFNPVLASGPRKLKRCDIDEEIVSLERRYKLINLKMAVQAGEAQMVAASTPTMDSSTNPPEPNWRQKTKENMGAEVRGALVATLPYAALNRQNSSSSSGNECVQASDTHRGPASCDKSVDEASASRAARFQGKVTKDSPQTSQEKVLWWHPYQVKFVKSPQEGQHADEFQAAKRAKQEDETRSSTSVWRGADGDGQAYHPEKSVTTVAWSNDGWSDGGEGAMMPVVEQDNTFGPSPLMVHWTEQGHKQAQMHSEAAAASWHNTNWHSSGWHDSQGISTPVSGGFPDYTSENYWGAAWQQKGTVRVEASAPQCGEVKAATVQQMMIGHQSSSLRIWTTEADCTLQEARFNTWQKQEAASFQRSETEHEVSRVNVCNCCVWRECLVHLPHVRHLLIKATWVVHMVDRTHLSIMSITEYSSFHTDFVS